MNRDTERFAFLFATMNVVDFPLRGLKNAKACLRVARLIRNRLVQSPDMKVVSVATLDSRAYFSILNRLKMTNLSFVSLTPIQARLQRTNTVITTRGERGFFEGTAIPIEDLDENPIVMEGQILSRMSLETRRVLLIGIDPGLRIGVVVFYGDSKLGSFTVESVGRLCSELRMIVRGIPNIRAIVRVGDGAPRLSKSISQMIGSEFRDVTLEVVDERGTTKNRRKSDGPTGDQGAAARIARRKGVSLTESCGRKN